MTGFVYKWSNNINGKWYIGSHKGTIDDGYRHSSKILKFAEGKYGLENFTREILIEGCYVGDKIKSKESAYLRKYNAANNPMSYNLTNITGPNCWNQSMRDKLSKSHMGSKNPMWGKTRDSKRKDAIEEGRTHYTSPTMCNKNKEHGFIRYTSTGHCLKCMNTRVKYNKRKVPVRIDGVVYESKREAARQLKKAKSTISRWAISGKAVEIKI